LQISPRYGMKSGALRSSEGKRKESQSLDSLIKQEVTGDEMKMRYKKISKG
jgi:hypothetical protein